MVGQTAQSDGRIMARPSVLVFDVNETLIDIEAMTPLFTQIFGDPRAMREWFAQLVMYSMTAALSRQYVDFFTLGQAVLRMLADIYGRHITDGDLDRIRQAMMSCGTMASGLSP
jgi:2-haloacid dehalogenase